MRPSIERYFSNGKQSRLLDKHQYMELQRVSLHAKLSVVSRLLTAWGRLRAGDYEHMRHMYIRLPRAGPTPSPAVSQDCAECCFCPQHGGIAARGRAKG